MSAARRETVDRVVECDDLACQQFAVALQRFGDPARVKVDAFPDLALTGRVDSWSPGTGSTFALLPPDNATGNFTKVVQRVPVKIVLDPNRALGVLVRPGMSVEATVDTGRVAAAANAPAPPQTAGQAERSEK